MWRTSQTISLHGPPSFGQTSCTVLVAKCCSIHPPNSGFLAYLVLLLFSYCWPHVSQGFKVYLSGLRLEHIECRHHDPIDDDLLFLVTIQGIKHYQRDISWPQLPVTGDMLKALSNCEIGHITCQLRKGCFGLHSL